MSREETTDLQDLKERERLREREIVRREYNRQVNTLFTDRELDLIFNCRVYVHNKPAGLPGHNLMVVVDKLCDLFGFQFPDDWEFPEDREEEE